MRWCVLFSYAGSYGTCSLCHAGLLLGVGSELMVEYHISAFLPQLGDRPVSDLFTADTFGPPPAQAGTRRLADPNKRSNMKRAHQSGEHQYV
jgi:hypothetical protein